VAQELARQYASGDLHPPMLLRGRRHTLSLPVDVSAHRRKCGQVGGGPTRLGHVHQSCRCGPPPSRHATSPDAAGRCRRRRGWYGRRCLWPRRGVGSTATGSTPAAGQRTPAAGRPSAVNLRRHDAQSDPTHLAAAARPRSTLAQNSRRTRTETSRRRLGRRQGRSPAVTLRRKVGHQNKKKTSKYFICYEKSARRDANTARWL